jgi:hypothetical protein
VSLTSGSRLESCISDEATPGVRGLPKADTRRQRLLGFELAPHGYCANVLSAVPRVFPYCVCFVLLTFYSVSNQCRPTTVSGLYQPVKFSLLNHCPISLSNILCLIFVYRNICNKVKHYLSERTITIIDNYYYYYVIININDNNNNEIG